MIRVLVAEDTVILRATLVAVLNLQDDLHAQGADPREIVADMFLSYGTVRDYLASAMTNSTPAPASTPCARPRKRAGCSRGERAPVGS